MIADAICWRGARPSLPLEAGVSIAAVVRGLLFRVLTTNDGQHNRPDRSGLTQDIERYTTAMAILGL